MPSRHSYTSPQLPLLLHLPLTIPLITVSLLHTRPLAHAQPDQVTKVKTHIRHHARMLPRSAHTVPPRLAPLSHAAELLRQQVVELIEPLFGPFHARGHHDGGEAFLESGDCVFDEGEVDVGELEDVVAEVAGEHDLARSDCYYFGAGGEVVC